MLGETLTYEVDQIRIVLPDELNDLKIEEGQDYCTLITCTPYGVNSHRLLIRGHRIANDAQGLIVEDVKQVQPLHEAIVLGILFLVLYIIICKILSKTILYKKSCQYSYSSDCSVFPAVWKYFCKDAY